MLGNAPFGLYCGKWDYRKMMENSEWYAAVLASDQKSLFRYQRSENALSASIADVCRSCERTLW